MVLERCCIVHALETLELLRTVETAPNPKVPCLQALRHLRPYGTIVEHGCESNSSISSRSMSRTQQAVSRDVTAMYYALCRW